MFQVGKFLHWGKEAKKGKGEMSGEISRVFCVRKGQGRKGEEGHAANLVTGSRRPGPRGGNG